MKDFGYYYCLFCVVLASVVILALIPMTIYYGFQIIRGSIEIAKLKRRLKKGVHYSHKRR